MASAKSSASVKKGKSIRTTKCVQAVLKNLDQVLLPDLEEPQVDMISEQVYEKFDAKVLKELFDRVFGKEDGETVELLRWLLQACGVDESLLVDNSELQAISSLSHLAAPTSAAGQVGETAQPGGTVPGQPGGASSSGGAGGSAPEQSGGASLSDTNHATPTLSTPIANLFHFDTPVRVKTYKAGKDKRVAVNLETLKVQPMDESMNTPDNSVSMLLSIFRKGKNSIKKFFTAKRKTIKRSQNNLFVEAGIDNTNKEYRPADPLVKSNKGLPLRQDLSRFSVVDPKFMCEGLEELGILRCPRCRRKLEATFQTVYHGVLIKFKCPGADKLLVKGTNGTCQKLGTLSAETIKKASDACLKEYQACNYNIVLNTSRRLKMSGACAIGIFKRGTERNKVSFNCFTEADYAMLAGSQIAMLTYSQYRMMFGSVPLDTTVFQKPQFYAVSTSMYDHNKMEHVFQAQRDMIQGGSAKVSDLLDDVKICMDSTFSQRRDAQFSMTVLMSAKTGLVWDLKVIKRSETTLKSIELEGVASKELTKEAINRRKTKSCPQFQSICSDGHIENAEMFRREFYELNKLVCKKGVFKGPTDCGKTLRQCLQTAQDSGCLCGVHGESLGSYGGMYRIEFQDTDNPGETVEKVFARDHILEFGFSASMYPKKDDEVYVVEDFDKLVHHRLDLWHVTATLRKAFAAKMKFLTDVELASHRGQVLHHLIDSLWKIVHNPNKTFAFTDWRRVCLPLGSIFETANENAINPKLVRAAEEIIFGEDLRIAAMVERDRTVYEKKLVKCSCPGLDCKCGKLPGTVDYVKKLGSKRKRGRPLAAFLDERRLFQLLDLDASSSYCESFNSFLHNFIHKRRHFLNTHYGRCAYLLCIWNCKRLHSLFPDMYNKKTGWVIEQSDAAKRFINEAEFSIEEMQKYFTIPGIEREVFKDMHLGLGTHPEELYDLRHTFMNEAETSA